MQIERLKDIIQSANMNFLFGSGLSRPYLSTLGEIETWLTDLNTRPGLNDVERDILRCSIISMSIYKVSYFQTFKKKSTTI